MKKIELGRSITNLRDKPIKDGLSQQIILVGDCIANLLAITRPPQAKDALRYLELAKIVDQRAHDADGKTSLPLEDAEFEIIKFAVERNTHGYNAMFLAQIMQAIAEAENEG